ncbi:unnamed protein product [Moneuplotes crassus]|uniref:RING-type domain-containing protein n=1 Tax=Euplotes crassus TaxID=5936 RepID=A0AAD2D8N8_EUPCR|nr:unnamed protein product [Moneuplotes crassus]
MECPSCKSKYNTQFHMPRVLTKCGHSLCEKCIRKIIIRVEQGYTQNCKECGSLITYDTSVPAKESSQLSEDYIHNIVHTFPKNLALLKDFKVDQSLSTLEHQMNCENSKTKETQQTEEEDKGSDENFCEDHPEKLIEAFCVDDSCLLCLECILSNNHRGHEVSSVSHGYSIQKGEIEELRHLNATKLKQIDECKNYLQTELVSLIEFDRKKKTLIDKLYQKITDTIELCRLEDQFQRQDDYNDRKDKISQGLLESSNCRNELKNLKFDLEELESLSQIRLLRKFSFNSMKSKLEDCKIPQCLFKVHESLDISKIISKVLTNISSITTKNEENRHTRNDLSANITSTRINLHSNENSLSQNRSKSALKSSSKCRKVSRIRKNSKKSSSRINLNGTPLTRNYPNQTNKKVKNNGHNTLADDVYGEITKILPHKNNRNDSLGNLHKVSHSKGKVARTQVHLYDLSINNELKPGIKNLKTSDSDGLSCKLTTKKETCREVGHINLVVEDKNNTLQNDKKEVKQYPEVVYEPIFSTRSAVKSLKSSSFAKVSIPNLQEVRNKAKQEKLDKKRLESQERIENIPDDYHENIKISEIKESKNQKKCLKNLSIRQSKENRNKACRKGVTGLKTSDRKSSISLLIHPYKPDPIVSPYAGLSDISKQEKPKKHGYFRIEEELNKTSKFDNSDRAFSNPRSLQKQNTNKSRHFQIRHEPSSLGSVATFQKLMNDFSDGKCKPKESAIKERDKESINTKAGALKKYMSSGVSCPKNAFKKVNRQKRERSYVDERKDISLYNASSDDKNRPCQKKNLHATSFINTSNSGDKARRSKFRPMTQLKMSSCKLTKGLPFEKINQKVDVPSIEFDFEDCMDEGACLSSTVEEVEVIEEVL